MFCPNCGNQIPDGSVFCSSCGTSIPGQANQQADATPQAPSSSEQPQAVAAQPQQQAQAQPQQQAQAQQAQPQAQAQPGYQQAQQQAQPGYQQAQPGYQQPVYQQPAQQVWPPQTPANRALAMSMYWSLLSWIFVLAVRDKNDPFITHHLNNVTVIIIGSVICSILMFIIIGIFGLIFLFVVEIIGTVSAYHGDMKPLPLISKIKIIK